MNRVAIIVSHPIQHFCPQYASFSKDFRFKFLVLFSKSIGAKKYFDYSFKREVQWNSLYLNEFSHFFLDQSSRPLGLSLWRQLSDFNPGLVIVYGYYQKLQIVAILWSVLNLKKILYISDSEPLRNRKKWKQIVKFPLLYLLFKRIDFFLSVGNWNETFYNNYGVKNSKIIRMHFPIDIVSFENVFNQYDQYRSEIRTILKIDRSSIVLCNVGKFLNFKRQMDIIKAVQILELRGIEFDVLMVGSGPELESLVSASLDLKKSKVHFVGFIDPENLPKYYAASDIYVHASEIEAHSLAISEAIYMGNAVICSDKCGSYGESDDVQIGKNGFVYPVGNCTLLADYIADLCINREKLAKFKAYSLEISRDFQKNAHFRVLDKILDRLP